MLYVKFIHYAFASNPGGQRSPSHTLDYSILAGHEVSVTHEEGRPTVVTVYCDGQPVIREIECSELGGRYHAAYIMNEDGKTIDKVT